MLRKALFNIIRREQREIEDKLQAEEHKPAPDTGRLATLRQEAVSLRRELEHYRDA